jgi:hypothetical protein
MGEPTVTDIEVRNRGSRRHSIGKYRVGRG